jgi:hypothetical protein
MKKYDLSNTEKYILKSLSKNEYKEGVFGDLSREELYVASNKLKDFGLIRVVYYEGGEVVDMKILEAGIVYLTDNPLLESPASDDELKRLQIDDFKYRERIRKQEDIIRLWQLSNAIVGFIGLTGWLLFFFLK